MKKCPKPLGYGIRRTPVVLGLSAALCMPAAFSYANVDNGMDRESVLSVMQGKTIKGQILDETGESMIGVSVLVKGTTIGTVTDFDGNYTLEVSIRPRACFFPLFSFLPLWLHYNLNPLCVQY